MAKNSSSFRLLIWFTFNLFLVVAILFVLHYFKIWSVLNFYDDFSKPDIETLTKLEDPNLLEKEELRKQKLSQNAREEIAKTKETVLQEMIKLHSEFKLQVKIKMDQLTKREEELNKRAKEENNRDKNIKDLAEKLTNMEIEAAVKIFEGLSVDDPMLVIDIFKKMDELAVAAGQGSSVPLFLSKMDVKQVREIMRLKAKAPGEEIEPKEPEVQ